MTNERDAIDMSERAITLRIRQVEQLRRLCVGLARAGTAIGREAPAEPSGAPGTHPPRAS
jgi:hypothetical protein